jgi:hypothetical protein
MPSKCQTPPQKSPSIIEHILRIWNRIQNGVAYESEAPGDYLWEKKQGSKISWHCSFKYLMENIVTLAYSILYTVYWY